MTRAYTHLAKTRHNLNTKFEDPDYNRYSTSEYLETIQNNLFLIITVYFHGKSSIKYYLFHFIICHAEKHTLKSLNSDLAHVQWPTNDLNWLFYLWNCHRITIIGAIGFLLKPPRALMANPRRGSHQQFIFSVGMDEALKHYSRPLIAADIGLALQQ